MSPLSTVTLLQGIHVLSLLLTFHAVLCAAVFLIPMSIVNIPMVLLTRLVYRSLLTCAGVRGGTLQPMAPASFSHREKRNSYR